MDSVNQAREQMQKALHVLKEDVATVRTGRATPSLVDHLVVSVYGGPLSGGAKMKIQELATVNVTDQQTIVITPFDQSITEEIAKGIQEANIGLTPSTDGNVIRISIPPLSEERRQELIHLMRQKLESGKIMVRQARHEAMLDVKKQEFSEDEKSRLEKEIQKATDDFIGQIDNLGKQKEEELLQI